MPIPVHIWEVIRKYEGVDLTYASKTDKEIQEYVEKEVDERLKSVERAENEKTKNLISLFGSMIYGSAETPRQEQIDRGVNYFKDLRDHQQQIKQAILELERQNQSRK